MSHEESAGKDPAVAGRVIERRGRVTFQITPRGEDVPKTGDPWIDAYLAFREEVLSGVVSTTEQAQECARDLQRGLPAGGPSVPAALFITSDIQIAFGERSALMRGLWVPR